jgi:2-amino-4-hydroxy-6-hydroxymethyldihydropteridine diphosphokinase
MLNRAYLAIGSNLGNRFLNIKESIYRLREKTSIREISSVEETEPVGYLDQRDFFNCVLEVDTELNAEELLDFCKSIEKNMGRKKTFKNGPRLIDIDIIFFNSQRVEKKGLKIPHPKMHKRVFVLKPLSELAPGFIHPELKCSVDQLLKQAS